MKLWHRGCSGYHTQGYSRVTTSLCVQRTSSCLNNLSQERLAAHHNINSVMQEKAHCVNHYNMEPSTLKCNNSQKIRGITNVPYKSCSLSVVFLYLLLSVPLLSHVGVTEGITAESTRSALLSVQFDSLILSLFVCFVSSRHGSRQCEQYSELPVQL